QIEIVDWIGGVASVVLDRTANNTGLGGESDRLRRCVRLMRETVFQIGVDRTVGGLGDHPAIGDRLCAGHFTIGAAEHVGEAKAGRSKSLEPQPSQQLCSAGYP